MSANYIFAWRGSDGLCQALYIGESDRFYERFSNHEKLLPAFEAGMNEVHIHLLAESQSERVAIETDLRRGHRTLLNAQRPGLEALLTAIM